MRQLIVQELELEQTAAKTTIGVSYGDAMTNNNNNTRDEKTLFGYNLDNYMTDQEAKHIVESIIRIEEYHQAIAGCNKILRELKFKTGGKYVSVPTR